MKLLNKPYGFSMLPLIVFMFFVVGILSAGIMMIGSKVSQGKQSDTLASLDSIAGSVIQWAAASRSLPPTLPTALGSSLNPTDPWGNNIIYVFDNNLTAIATGGLCGRTTTNLTVNGTANSAFALLSAGNSALLSSWSGIPALSTAGPFAYLATTTGTTATLVSPNLSKIVTLEELKNRAGCYGTTRGRLRIVNNELPKGCSGNPYSATVVADGGVPFAGTSYQWSIAGLPAGVTATPSAVYPAWTTASTALQLGGTTSFGTLTVYVRDNNAPQNVIQKSLTIASAASCGSGPINFNNLNGDFTLTAGVSNNLTIDTTTKTINLGNNQYNGTDGYACLWYKTNQILAAHTFRGYFNFTMQLDASAASTTNGDGFTFTLMQGANTTSVCGGAGEALGYGSRDGHSIPGDSFAIEFDTYPNGGENDPGNYNHVAVVKGGTVLHNGGGSPAMGSNPSCTGASHPGCYYINPISWLENGATHKARIEVTTSCDATCASCGLAPPNSNALVKVWIDCTDATCNSLAANYLAETPSATHCLALPATMNNVKLGFTEATWGATQSTIISNFIAGFY